MSKIGFKLQVIAALPGTLPEISKKSQVKKQTVVRWLRILQDSGLCHVGSWRRPKAQGPLMRVYVEGPGTDAKRPQRMSMAVYKARYRKSHPLETDIYNARRRAISAADRAVCVPQTWLSALTGASC